MVESHMDLSNRKDTIMTVYLDKYSPRRDSTISVPNVIAGIVNGLKLNSIGGSAPDPSCHRVRDGGYHRPVCR